LFHQIQKDVENERFKKFESVYSKKVRAGKRRTYFFDVRKTKGEDFYITLTESTKKFNSEEYERHKIFLYKEDFNRFLSSLEEAINHVKTELMPDYNYEEFDHRDEEEFNHEDGDAPRYRDRDRGDRDRGDRGGHGDRPMRPRLIIEDAKDEPEDEPKKPDVEEDALPKSEDDISW
jgi:hypothetical protein